MSVSRSRVYPQGLEEVYRRLPTEAFVAGRYRALGALDVRVSGRSIGPSGGSFDFERDVKAELPSFARRALGERSTLCHEERWSPSGAGWRCDFVVAAKQQPVRLFGVMELSPKGEGTEHRITLDVEVKIPLIGGKVAKWLSGNFGRNLELELAWNAERLAAPEA
jgi:hypothetical protein